MHDSAIVTVTNVNDAPALGGVPEAVTVVRGTTLSFTATTTGPGSFSLVGVPVGASINPITGVFIWTPSEDLPPSTYTFQVRVSDGVNTSSQLVIVQVVSAALVNGDLVVSGTSLADTITVIPNSDPTRVSVLVNGQIQGTFALADITGRIVVRGFAGNDRITVSGVSKGADLFGGVGNDTLKGAFGADRLNGEAGNDTLFGRAGNDALTGSSGADRLNGGAGTDTVEETADANFTLTPTALVGVGSDTLSGIERAYLAVSPSSVTGQTLKAGTFTGFVTLVGAQGNDILVGGKGASVLMGGGGNDKLTSGGRTLLIGGSGSDILNGGSNGDILAGGLTRYHDEASGLVDRAALDAMMKEWRSPTPYAIRVAHLLGALPSGLNGDTLLNATTVFDDGSVDTLRGAGGLDWFLTSPLDHVSDLDAGGLEIQTTV